MKLENAAVIITQGCEKLLKSRNFIIIAVDGRCAAGKTTLAEFLQKKTGCNVIHTDDFFLRSEQRTEERLANAGGNIDHERLEKEVILPLMQNKEFYFRPFSCRTMDFKPPVFVPRNRITVVEGAYSCNKYLYGYYDYRIFADAEKNLQRERVKRRNPDNYKDFFNRWIPLEERYFSECEIQKKCDITVEII